MLRVKAGDLDQMTVLYERYNRMLFGFFFKTTLDTQVSEDLVQVVFVKMIKYREQYRAEEGAFLPWMFRIAHNAHIDSYHSFNRHRSDMDLAKADPPAESNPEQDLLRKEKFGLIKEALGRLTEEQREVLIMSRYQDLPYREIARILKCREGTVKARVFRAVEKLRLVCRQLEGR